MTSSHKSDVHPYTSDHPTAARACQPRDNKQVPQPLGTEGSHQQDAGTGVGHRDGLGQGKGRGYPRERARGVCLWKWLTQILSGRQGVRGFNVGTTSAEGFWVAATTMIPAARGT